MMILQTIVTVSIIFDNLRYNLGRYHGRWAAQGRPKIERFKLNAPFMGHCGIVVASFGLAMLPNGGILVSVSASLSTSAPFE